MDASVVYGENSYDFDSANTINASIAAEYLQNNPGASDADIAANSGPNSGFSGGRSFDQLTLNLDFAGSVDMAESPLYVAFGAEYRDESADSEAGILESYSCGSVAGAATIPSVLDPDETAGCGFQAFSGISSDSVIDVSRSSFALYLDLERNITDSWLLAAATRYEDYDDFGSELTGKISSRIDLSDNFSLRGAVSTGFRAPALQQSSFQAFQTNISDAGVLERSFTAGAGSAFPVALGVENLEFETSNNYSLGFVWIPMDNLTVTLDTYKVDIDDRIILGGNVNRDTVAGNAEAIAVYDRLAVNDISFFSNAVNTSTEGVDLIVSYDTELSEGNLNVTLAMNLNETEIDSFNVPEGATAAQIFPSQNRSLLTDGQPQERGTLSLNWSRDRVNALVRFNYFGETEVDVFAQNHIGVPDSMSPSGGFQDTSVVDAAVLVDIDISYDVTENLALSIGANNIFDEQPDELGDDSVLNFISGGFDTGFRFPIRAVPYGFNGASYYVKAAFNF